MRRATNIIMPAILLLGVLAMLLTSGPGCGGKPTPTTTIYYEIGQASQTSREILTVSSANRIDRYDRVGFGAMIDLYVTAPPGIKFVIVEVTVTNVGSGSLGISPNDFSLKDSEGRSYASRNYQGLNPYPSKKLSPGDSAYGYVVFAVPDIAAGLELSCVLQGSQPVLGVWQLAF